MAAGSQGRHRIVSPQRQSPTFSEGTGVGIFVTMASDLNPSLKTIPFLKDVPRRALRAAGRGAAWFSLPAGKRCRANRE